MPYSVKKPPDWLKNLPKSAIKLGVEVFNRVFQEKQSEEQARKAAWSAIKGRFEKDESDGWRAKSDLGADRNGIIHFRASAADDTGLVWEAVLIEPGLSQGFPRFYWSDELLEEYAGVFEGVDVNAYELTADFFNHLQVPYDPVLEDVKRYLTGKKVGYVEAPVWEPGVGIKARIVFLTEQIPELLKKGRDQGNENVLGLSIDTRIRGMEIQVEDMPVVWPTKIVSCSSVDVVTRPAAGGKFLRAVAAQEQEERGMNAKLLKLIKDKRPKLLEGKDEAQLTEDEVLELAQMALDAEPEPQPANTPGEGGDGAGQRAAQGLTPEEMDKRIKGAIQEVEQRAACARMLDAGLAQSRLPDEAQARVRETLGQTFEQKDLDAAIKREKDYLAKMSSPGFELDEQGQGQIRVSGGVGTLQRVAMACDMAFGLTPEDLKDLQGLRRLDGKHYFEDRASMAIDPKDYDNVEGLTGLRELYIMLTGDTEVSGRFMRDGLPADLRASQDITSATFSYILGNTLSRRLVKDYRGADFQENLLISSRKPVKDFRQQEAVMVGYFGELSTVDPETEDYQEIEGVTDEEATYSITTRGNLLTVTRKTVINDDMSLVQRLVRNLGRAARLTHAKYVWNFFKSNLTCSDGTAWFTSGHGNLGSNGLSFAYALAAYQALAKMTEKDSGERIGLLDDPAMKPVLVYPVDLMATAESIVNDDYYYTSNDLTDKTRNPMKGKITGAQITLLTDANDWGLLLPPSVVDMVEMGYLNGRQEPEMFVADTPNSEQVFVADKIRHKIRHEYAGTVIDYRSGYKAVVS
jgi:cation transport regulator ChaB